MPLLLIAFYLLVADVILLAEGETSSTLELLIAFAAALLATIAYGGTGGWWRRP